MSEKIWRVYTHTTPDGLKYVGVTSQKKLYLRWRPSHYKRTSLQPFIEKYGWKSIQHEVIYTCDNKNEAFSIEDEMIQYWHEMGVCINKHRSGLIMVSDVKSYKKVYNKTYHKEHAEERIAYQRAYNKEHAEERKSYMKVYDKARLSTPEGKIYSRVKDYNRNHPDNITITPLEARYNYTTYGIIPDFIKSDDIPNAILYNPSISTEQLPLF